MNNHWTIVSDGHYNSDYKNNLYNGFTIFPSALSDRMQEQALIFQNALGLLKISIDNFTGDPLKWHQWFSFFRATIHNDSGLSDA